MSRERARNVYSANNLSSHASLLLSASPTIITSQLQTSSMNTNNPQSHLQRRNHNNHRHNQQNLHHQTSSTPLANPTSSLHRSISLLRRQQPATPLLATANNLDPTILNSDLSLNVNPPSEEYINFKKPQNEIFKKLDGKIQKIVAAHSNLNKLYALNDFSGLSTRRPFELPAQLPPPPPWVPKSTSPDNNSGTSSPFKDDPNQPIKIETSTNPTIGSAQFALLAQKIKLTLQNESAAKSQGNNVSEDDKRKFQENLIALLKKEISAVAKNADLKLDHSSRVSERSQYKANHHTQSFQRTPPMKRDQRSLLLNSSPQTLYNTIRRETTMLLNKRDIQIGGRSSLSLLMEHSNNSGSQSLMNLESGVRQQFEMMSNRMHSVKVVIPPTECNPTSRSEMKQNVNDEIDHGPDGNEQNLDYYRIKNKIAQFQRRSKINLAKTHKSSSSLLGGNLLKRKNSPQKTLDKIVDRLQAKRSPLPGETPSFSCSNSPLNDSFETKMPSLHEQIMNSANLIRNSRLAQQMSAPTPIPIFRSSLTASGKRGYQYSAIQSNKLMNMKSKKHKKLHQNFGLKIGNYIDRECPQKGLDKLTIEQYALGLDLVPKNDASLQYKREQIQQSDAKFKLFGTNRPLRLQRIRANSRRFV